MDVTHIMHMTCVMTVTSGEANQASSQCDICPPNATWPRVTSCQASSAQRTLWGVGSLSPLELACLARRKFGRQLSLPKIILNKGITLFLFEKLFLTGQGDCQRVVVPPCGLNDWKPRTTILPKPRCSPIMDTGITNTSLS